MRPLSSYVIALLTSAGLLIGSPAGAANPELDAELTQLASVIRNHPENASAMIAGLQQEEAQMNAKQQDRFRSMVASVLGIRGRYQEQIDYVNAHFSQAHDVNLKARYLYYLSDAYSNLGNYEQSIIKVNEALALFPQLTTITAKLGTLQAAITLFRSLHLYDDALNYADRMYSLTIPGSVQPQCNGAVNRANILFDARRNELARQGIPEIYRLCTQADARFLIQIVDIMLLEDLIDAGKIDEALKKGAGLLTAFANIDDTSDYVSQLYFNLARANLQKNELKAADEFAGKALSIAQARGYTEWIGRSAETLGQVKRATGNLAASAHYFEVALQARDRLFADQLQKNLAYQRVRMEVKDKENQLERLEQKNRELKLQQKLEREQRQNLILMIGLIALAMLLLGVWLYRTIRVKNRFQRDAQVDGLTQIVNRHYFFRLAERACQRQPEQISVILFDMDHFKAVNDSCGHATGDWVLRNVAAVVSGLLREGDIFGRYGGEEFAVCLPTTGALGALQFAERCRIAVAEIDSAESGHRFALSASFGVAAAEAGKTAGLRELLEQADQALYQSKARGRNCVSLAGTGS